MQTVKELTGRTALHNSSYVIRLPAPIISAINPTSVKTKEYQSTWGPIHYYLVSKESNNQLNTLGKQPGRVRWIRGSPLLVPASSSGLLTGESRVDDDFRSLASVEDGPLFAAEVETSSTLFLAESDVFTESGEEGSLSTFLASISCSRELRDPSFFFLLEN